LVFKAYIFGSYEAFFIASAFASVAALTIFTVFPTYVIRPALAGTDWPSQLCLPTSITYPIRLAG
jgi:hypothetical protein